MNWTQYDKPRLQGRPIVRWRNALGMFHSMDIPHEDKIAIWTYRSPWCRDRWYECIVCWQYYLLNLRCRRPPAMYFIFFISGNKCEVDSNEMSCIREFLFYIFLSILSVKSPYSLRPDAYRQSPRWIEANPSESMNIVRESANGISQREYGMIWLDCMKYGPFTVFGKGSSYTTSNRRKAVVSLGITI